MNRITFSTAGSSKALDFAVTLLKSTYHFLPSSGQDATHLLLPVPSLTPDGSIIGGGDLDTLLQSVSKDVTIIGGNLNHPKLLPYKTIDLLKDPMYLAQNAKITAYCAILYALQNLPVILADCPVLILGFGRISKCLAKLLQQMGADVTVAARKTEDRALSSALGYKSIEITAVDENNYRLIYNTVPQMVLPNGNSRAIKIELASVPGMAGENVISARGLPGKHAPEDSGKLIAQTIRHMLDRKDDSL